MVNSKIIQVWTYLKANKRIHGTLHTLPKPPPSFDNVDWLTEGYNLLAILGKLMSNIIITSTRDLQPSIVISNHLASQFPQI